MNVEVKDFAEAADLLASSSGEKEVLIQTLGKKVRIKKVTVGELADIMKVAKDNELEQYIWLVYKGLVQPKLKPDQIRKLNHKILLEIALEIQKFSELDKASIDKLANLLQTKS